MEEWQYALIKLNDGRGYDLAKVLLDIINQRLYFTTNHNVEMFFPARLVKEVII